MGEKPAIRTAYSLGRKNPTRQNNRIMIPKEKIRSYFSTPTEEYKSPIKNATVKQLYGVLV